MSAARAAWTDEGLIYELTPGWAEGWVRVSLARGSRGARIVMEGHNFEYRLAPTPFVLEGVTESLRAITPEEILRGQATIGPLGVQALEYLLAFRKLAA